MPIPRPLPLKTELHGRTIYAYRHIRTNQIIYSLTHNIKRQELKQFPDLGANNTPAEFRGDLWQPLWTLQLPRRDTGYQQGLEIFQKLREHKILREYNTPKGTPLVFNEEVLQAKLDGRGGNKIETVSKLKIRKNKRTRIREIMDQKANSIADLAAILLSQDKRTAKLSIAQREELKGRARSIAELSRQRHTLPAVAEKISQNFVSTRLPADQFAHTHPGDNKSKLRKEIDTLRKQQRSIEEAAAIVDIVNNPDGLRSWRKKAKPTASSSVGSDEDVQRLDAWLKQEGSELSAHEQALQQEDYQQRFATFMSAPQKTMSAKDMELASYQKWQDATLIGRVYKHLLTQEGKMHDQRSLKGVELFWKDPLDKGHAVKWPALIEHKADAASDKFRFARSGVKMHELRRDESFYVTERPVYEELVTLTPKARETAIKELVEDNEGTRYAGALRFISALRPDIQLTVLKRAVELTGSSELGSKLHESMKPRLSWLQELAFRAYNSAQGVQRTQVQTLLDKLGREKAFATIAEQATLSRPEAAAA